MVLVEATVEMSFHFLLVERAELTHRAGEHHPEGTEIIIQIKIKEDKEVNIEPCVYYVPSPFQEAPPLPHLRVLVLTLVGGLFALWTFLLLLFG